MRFVLAGQPNSGKSTIFNAVTGYRSATANLPGSSLSYTVSRAMVLGREVAVADLPGFYSLTSGQHAERRALRFLATEEYDVIIDVVDASRLGRSLELTLQLLALGRPVVVALNMTDEARRKGLEIDHEALSEELGVPVIPTIGRRGRGLRTLFRTALRASQEPSGTEPLEYDRELETAIARVVEALETEDYGSDLPSRFVAIKLLERDPDLTEEVLARLPGLADRVEQAIAELEDLHGWPVTQVISGSRHAVAHHVEERVTTVHRPTLGWRERVDRLLLHPWTGGPLMLLILAGFFYLVFGVGKLVETPLVEAFSRLAETLARVLPVETLAGALAAATVMGISGGVAIVLPYLLPFLIGLSLLEHSGYLPRMAYILDSLMHRIGLHGKSVVPLMLGYGCSVPAIMATRILESPRDRRITVALTAFIPCSARTIVIYALVAAYLGPLWALGVYLLNLLVIVILGMLMARTLRGRSPGLILEIPDLQLPSMGTLFARTWLSLKDFIIIAWPVLIASSAFLGVLEWAGADRILNGALSPFTVTVLGLPAAVGVTLVFGVLRKELSLVMLMQALGTTAVGSVMTDGQLMTLTLFIVFYVPCVATIAVMAREIGWRDTAWVTALTVVVATVVAVLARAGFALAA